MCFACVNFLVFTLGLEATFWDLAHTGDHTMVLTDLVTTMLTRFYSLDAARDAPAFAVLVHASRLHFKNVLHEELLLLLSTLIIKVGHAVFCI